jgi:hypothetical protein
VSLYAFLDPGSSYPLPPDFDYAEYIDIEREFWALFPETDGKRVNFCQLGLTAQIFVESGNETLELASDETYFLMPCADQTLRPVKMRAFRRLTLGEYRMTHLTALKLFGKMHGIGAIMEQVHLRILGPEIAGEPAL